MESSRRAFSPSPPPPRPTSRHHEHPPVSPSHPKERGEDARLTPNAFCWPRSVLGPGFTAPAVRPETNHVGWQNFKGQQTQPGCAAEPPDGVWGGEVQTPQHQDGPQQAGGDAMWQHTACVTPAKQRTRGTGGKEEDSHRFPEFLSSSPLQTLLCAPMGRAQLSQLWSLPTPTTAARTRRHHRAPPAHPHAVGEASIAPQDPPRPRRGISQCTLHGHRG